jgi:hypothetical protein
MGQTHQLFMTQETLLVEQLCAQGTLGNWTLDIRITVNSERQVLTRTGGNSWNKLTEEILLKPKHCLQASSTCILKYYCLRFS